PFYLDHITLFGLLRWRLASLTDHSLIKSYGCYYIFKSIVNGPNNTVNALGTSNNPTALERFWADWNQRMTDGVIPQGLVPTAKNIGFLIGSFAVNFFGAFFEPFFASSLIEILPMRVREGDWIGDWMENHTVQALPISFEIVLRDNDLFLGLNYFRTPSALLDVTNEVNAVSSASAGTLASAEFDLKVAKSKVLSYIDPAAFFGMHYSIGVAAFGQNNNIGNFAFDDYWSSNEFDNDQAWAVSFNNGSSNFKLKGETARVRSIRAF
ncbi:MAG: hypothetical protein ACPGVI_03490, partial [Crocinitomicaceae bacterium]